MIDRIAFNKEFLNPYGKDLVVEIIDIIFSDYEERMIKLRANVADREFDQLKFNAHKFFGSIATFRDPVATKLASDLEQLAKNCQESGLDKVFKDFEKSAADLMEELKAIRAELTS